MGVGVTYLNRVVREALLSKDTICRRIAEGNRYGASQRRLSTKLQA